MWRYMIYLVMELLMQSEWNLKLKILKKKEVSYAHQDPTLLPIINSSHE